MAMGPAKKGHYIHHSSSFGQFSTQKYPVELGGKNPAAKAARESVLIDAMAIVFNRSSVTLGTLLSPQ